MTTIRLAPALEQVLDALAKEARPTHRQLLGRVATSVLLTSREVSVAEACDAAFDRQALPVDEELVRYLYESLPRQRRWLVAASAPFDRLPKSVFERMWKRAFWRADPSGRFQMTFTLGTFLARNPAAAPRFREELRACARDSSAEVRIRGLQLLGLASVEKADRALFREALVSRSPSLRLAAVNGLALLVTHRGRAAGLSRAQYVLDGGIRELLATLAARDADQYVRRAAKNLLSRRDGRRERRRR